MIKTFRGKLEEDTQERIRLATIKGKVGYQIKAFQLMPEQPGISSAEHVCKLYITSQSTIDETVDFSDSNLLAVAYYQSEPSSYSDWVAVVFDGEVFNQDIYITHADARQSDVPVNYYIELEVIPLTETGAEYTTIKDLRAG
jgi:hypothetical protein